MTNTSQSWTSTNRLLAAVSPEALLQMGARSIDPVAGEVVQAGDLAPTHVLFPDLGVIASVIREAGEGNTVEVGLIGGTGATPLQSALASLPTRSETMVQVPGRVTLIPAAAVRETFATNDTFRDRVLLYQSIYFDEVAQNVICNRLHQLEARLAKWLIVASHYAGKQSLVLTHEFLSHMLGVRRAGVTLAINDLTLGGLIRHTRGAITIVDQEGLEQRACECQDVLREGWDRLSAQ